MKKTDELDDFGFLIKSSVLRGIVPRLERVKRSVRLVMVTNVLMIVLVFIPQIAGKLAGGRAPAILKTWTGKAVAIPMTVGISVLFLLATTTEVTTILATTPTSGVLPRIVVQTRTTATSTTIMQE